MTAEAPPDFLLDRVGRLGTQHRPRPVLIPFSSSKVDSISHPLDAMVARSSAVALVGSRIVVNNRSDSGFSLPPSMVLSITRTVKGAVLRLSVPDVGMISASQDPSARISVPGFSLPTRSRDNAMSDFEHGPVSASRMAGMPHSANPTSRACGNAAYSPQINTGRPKKSTLQECQPDPGPFHQSPRAFAPPTRNPGSPAGQRDYHPREHVKYAISQSGNDRLRCAVRPASASTCSTTSAEKTRVSKSTVTKSNYRR